MKVLIVATVQSHICQFHRPLVEMLHEHGCEVHAAARNNLAEKNGLKLDFVEQVFDVPFDRSPFSPKNIWAYRKLKKVIAAGNYDVIHCNTPVGGVLSRLAARKARKTGTKVYYTAHGFHFYKGAPVKNWLLWYPVEKLMSHFTDKLITITNEDYEMAKQHFSAEVCHTHGVGANSHKYKVVTAEEVLQLREKLGYRADDKIILCVGELLPNKNQITAIRMVPIVLEKVPNAKLILAGNGPERDNLENEVSRLGLEDAVSLVGYRSDLENYVNIADVSVSCSYREGMPLNIIEAMLCCKSVVVSDNRGHRELVKDGINGFVIPDASDSKEFAKQVTKLLTDNDLSKRMAKAGHSIGIQYADECLKKELEEIYYG